MTKSKKQINATKSRTQKKKSHGAKAPRNTTRSVIKSIGSTVGSMYGPIGSRIGSHAADYIARIMGQGDYKVSKNTLLTNSGPPSFATNGDDVIIKHREFVMDRLSTTTFSNTNYLINPGNSTLFPWLSQFATSFEEYEFLGLIVEYKSTSGSAIASTNNALGSVIIATDYNCSNANMTTKRAMETVEFSTSAGTDTSILHPIECDKSRNVLARQYTTSATSVGAVADPKFHFLGNLQIATVGQQAANINIGEIWVSYQIRLSRPTFSSLSEVPPSSTYYSHCVMSLDSAGVQPSNATTVNGYLDYSVIGNSPFFYFHSDHTSHGSVTDVIDVLPKGLYQIDYIYTYYNNSGSTTTITTATAPTIVLGAHASGLGYTLDNTTTSVPIGSSAATYFGAPPATVANTVTVKWGGINRVFFNPVDNFTEPYYIGFGRYSISGGAVATGTYMCDITVTYISPTNLTLDRGVNVSVPDPDPDIEDISSSPVINDYVDISTKREETSSVRVMNNVRTKSLHLI